MTLPVSLSDFIHPQSLVWHLLTTHKARLPGIGLRCWRIMPYLSCNFLIDADTQFMPALAQRESNLYLRKAKGKDVNFNPPESTMKIANWLKLWWPAHTFNMHKKCPLCWCLWWIGECGLYCNNHLTVHMSVYSGSAGSVLATLPPVGKRVAFTACLSQFMDC